MIIKFIGFLLFLAITISGFWCVFFLSFFSIYWIVLSLFINVFMNFIISLKRENGKKI